jgi:phosphoglycerol transferase MdoB-like AlkP superfamily enzyme
MKNLLSKSYALIKKWKSAALILRTIAIIFFISAVEVSVLDGHLFATDLMELLNHKKMLVRELTILISLNLFICLIKYRLARNALLALTVASCFAISAVDVIKISETTIPFLISDLAVARHAQSLSMYGLDSRLTVLGICCVIFFTVIIFLLRSLHIIKRGPLIGAFLISTLMASYLLTDSGPLPIHNLYWDYRQSARFNGFLVYQYLYARDLKLLPPERLREEVSKLEIKKDRFCYYWHSQQSISFKARNTAIILLESFWDLESAGYRFNQPVAPNFRSLTSKHLSKRIIVPTFGGHTANAEFEILTGNPAKFFPNGSIVYTNYVKRPIPSLVGTLKSASFNTLAVHNFHKWFWHRDQVYKTMGFDNFIGLDDIGDIKWTQGWPEDRPVFEKVLKLLKENKSPQFVFGITVNSHGPYGNQEIEGSIKEGYDPNGQALSEPWLVYANKINRLDFELGKFINEANKIVPKPLIVLFGDHLPSIAQDAGDKMYENRIIYVNSERVVGNDAIIPLHCATVDILGEIPVPISPFYESKREWCKKFEKVGEVNDVIDDYANSEEGKAFIYDRVIGSNQTVPPCIYPNHG